MRSHFWLFVTLGLVWHIQALSALAQQTTQEVVECRGKVVNSVTGEPVGDALVQIYALGQRVQFTRSDGTFAFADLPPGSYSPVARKLGFFNDQELSRGAPPPPIQAATNEPVVLKLTPEAIIYGEVKNENEQPLEGVVVRAQQWQVQNGQRKLATLGDTVTDDEGNFRLANLSSGRYYLSFPSSNGGGWSTTYQLNSKKQDKQGYGAEFYPGVSDVKSATVIETRPGAQVHIVQALRRERLFEVSGVVHGADPESGFNLMLMNSAGDFVQKGVRINPKTGQFQLQGVPAGAYLLRVTANMRPALRNTASGLLALADEEPRPLTAALPLQVYSDVSGLVVLGTGTSIGVQVRDETSESNGANGLHQVLLQMAPHEFSSFSAAIMMPPNPRDRRAMTRFEGLAPDTYTVEAMPNGPWYIASLRCGGEDLLRDDLAISEGASLPPIEVTLRDDGAQLTVHVKEKGQSAVAGILLFSSDYPRRSQLLGSATSLSTSNLAPGTYYVIAMRDAQSLEFRSPAVMAPYLANATEVTLGPRASVTVAAEVQQEEQHQ
ncbi:MAG TPA: carboxypeptidase-like regulatory domain-containing protein [Candidatus Acidoferrum sp.]|nr:carboxypeptidase-like regulatory domain-containing protein [Candidatus Acidoferrum sp.]